MISTLPQFPHNCRAASVKIRSLKDLLQRSRQQAVMTLYGDHGIGGKVPKDDLVESGDRLALAGK